MKNNKQPVFKKHYLETVLKELKSKHGYGNVHEVPCIEKIVINSAIGADMEKVQIAELTKDISKIAGQKPIITRARTSISNFKLKEGMPNGVKVTLRGHAMYEFLYLLISIALPAIRDFRGVSNKLDGRGNYTLGIADHTIFPQITGEGGKKNIGMDITIVTSANTDEEGRSLLALFGMPFRKSATQQEAAQAA